MVRVSIYSYVNDCADVGDEYTCYANHCYIPVFDNPKIQDNCQPGQNVDGNNDNLCRFQRI